MLKKTALRIAAVGVVAAALVSATAASASAAVDPTVGSHGPYYLVESIEGTAATEGQVMNWTTDYSGSPEATNTDFDKAFTGPADAESVRVFISPRGQERTPSAWVAYNESGFMPGTKNVLLPAAQLSAMVLGPVGANGVRAAGGNYSLGFAFMKTNNLAIASDAIYYTNISITPGTGTWTFAIPSTEEPPAEPSGSFDVNLEATTIAAQDGTLNLVAPASGTATIGNPTLVNGLSTSTGTLGQFSVEDGRVVTHPGWTLTTTVTDFTNSADSSKVIANKQLGLAPKLVEPNAAVTLANAQTAGSAVYPSVFAQTDDSAAVATTKFDADLTFVSPANMPAGTYTSKLTLTLASK
ncbi:hypothetical protein [Herbiconiux sp. UC225_62]|uniref:hypothetical protein n=1 Tax=Herbiconiux sp. UC225_62 TaxID=3350168 RepID=UPI0036D3C238